MSCTTAARLLAGHTEDDDAEALIEPRPIALEWALEALIEETESALHIAYRLHQARPTAPAGALDEQIVYHCAAVMDGAAAICERLLRDLPDAR